MTFTESIGTGIPKMLFSLGHYLQEGEMPMKKIVKAVAALVLSAIMAIPIQSAYNTDTVVTVSLSDVEASKKTQKFNIADIPEYEGYAYVEVNGNKPFFTSKTKKEFEKYSDLDSLGRCGVAYANISLNTMPAEERGAIGMVKPSGWHTVKYDDIDGRYLYNRCHLIGYQLAGENANEKNLITGTRYLNIEGMLPFENLIADYVKETGHHVMYRVTPIFKGKNLVASGVLMEALSVEDNQIRFCVYCYNVQPGVSINYKTGDSKWTGKVYNVSTEKQQNNTEIDSQPSVVPSSYSYVLNKNTKKFHRPDCQSVEDMKEKNKVYTNDSRDEIIAAGYTPCGRCHP